MARASRLLVWTESSSRSATTENRARPLAHAAAASRTFSPPSARASIPRPLGAIPGVISAVWVAMAPLEHKAEVLCEPVDRVSVLQEGIAVRRPDDHRPERRLVVSRRREHRRDERVPLLITQGEKHRHSSLNVCFQPDVSLNERSSWSHIGSGCTLLRLDEILLDRVAHRLRLKRGFYLGLNAEPGLVSGGVTDIAHTPPSRAAKLPRVVGRKYGRRGWKVRPWWVPSVRKIGTTR